MTDEELMRLALAEADMAFALGEVPVGAVLARQGQVIARARVEHRGRTTCLVSITVDDGAGTVYASGRFTFFCTGTL